MLKVCPKRDKKHKLTRNRPSEHMRPAQHKHRTFTRDPKPQSQKSKPLNTSVGIRLEHICALIYHPCTACSFQMSPSGGLWRKQSGGEKAAINRVPQRGLGGAGLGWVVGQDWGQGTAL